VYPVKYLDDVIKINGIHFYGCSFTAGEELANEEFLPLIGKCEDSDQRELLSQKHEKIEKQLAYPQHLCNKLGITNVYNRGQRGNSIDNMRSQFFNDVIHEKISDTHLCMFGTTGFFREVGFHSLEHWAEIGRSNIDERYRGCAFNRVVPTHHDRGGDHEFALKYFRERHSWIHFYEYMNNLRDILYIANRNNIPVIFVECLERINVQYFEKVYLKKHEQLKHLDYEYKDNLLFIEKEINRHMITDKVFSEYNDKHGDKRMPRGHPCLQAHIEWGEHLADCLKV